MLGPKTERNVSIVAIRLYKNGVTSKTMTDETAKTILDNTDSPDLCNRLFQAHKEKVKSYIQYYEAWVSLDTIPENELSNLIDDDNRKDLLTTALEGGSNYWYLIKPIAHDIIDRVTPPTEEKPFVDRFFEALKADKHIPIHDLEDDSLLGGISMRSIRKGEMLMQQNAPYHFADILSENDDGATADVWFQYAIMGEIVYG